LTNLQSLDLTFDLLTSLPVEFGKLTKLQKLNLRYNKLTSLPVEFGKLTKLQKLYLDNNPISTDEKEQIKKLLPHCEIRF
jgi:Leucine-rich repeat (LRR) protein